MRRRFSEHVQPVGTSVKWFYASQYKQKVYRSALLCDTRATCADGSTCDRALRTLVTGTELAEFRHATYTYCS